MILIGQFDSPFVRRVGVTMHLYAMTFAHRPWSVFADAPRVRAASPLGRVPILLLDDGGMLPDSHSIMAYLDSLAGDSALTPPPGPAGLEVLRRTALATGVAEKAVALVYETRLHAAPDQGMIRRIEWQIAATLDYLERECAAARTAFWHGETPGHDDVALGCASRFMAEAHPALLRHPRILAHGARCEALPAFRLACQTFAPPS